MVISDQLFNQNIGGSTTSNTARLNGQVINDIHVIAVT